MHRTDVMNAGEVMETPRPAPIDRAVARAAAQWVLRLQEADCGPRDRLACERWRAADPEHERAWQRAQDVSRMFGALPREIAMPTLGRKERRDRRAMLKSLVVLICAGTGGYAAYRGLPWSEWSADERTAAGEQREMTLADGTRVHLNTGTAIDVSFDARQRVLYLRAGELAIETGRDSDFSGPHRPFIVRTAQGSARALGTRFVVRQDQAGEGWTQVAVQQGAVEIRPMSSEAARVIQAGQQARFTATAIGPSAVLDPHVDDWTRGLFYADNMRLGDFARELGRYRAGLVRCDPQVADLRITGVFRLGNLDDALAALPDTLPVSVVYRTRYWVNIAPPDQGR